MDMDVDEDVGMDAEENNNLQKLPKQIRGCNNSQQNQKAIMCYRCRRWGNHTARNCNVSEQRSCRNGRMNSTTGNDQQHIKL